MADHQTPDQQATTDANAPKDRHLYAVFDSAIEAEQAAQALVAAGFDPRRLQPVDSPDAFEEPDASASPLAKLGRFVQRLGGETHDAERYAGHLAEGRVVLVIAAEHRDAAVRIADVVKRHGAYDVTYFYPLAKEYMSPEANARHGLPTYATTNIDEDL